MTDATKHEVDATEQRWKSELWSFLELLALAGIAFTQPTLDLLRRNAIDILVPRSPTPFEMWAVTAVIVFTPVLQIWLLEAIVGIFAPRVRPRLHVALLAALFGLIVYMSAQRELVSPTPLAAALVLGTAAGWLIWRFRVLHTYLRILAIGPLIFSMLFLFSPAIAPFAIPGRAVGAVEGPAPKDPRHVVVIVLDEFPEMSLLDGSGHIDRSLYPNIAALAEDSRWYRNTTSIAPFTQVAVPAIVTGSYPTQPQKLPIASEYPNNLFTLLGGSYELNVHEATVERLCPRSLCKNGDDSFASNVRTIVDDARELWTKSATTSGVVTRSKVTAAEATGATLADQVPQARRFVRSLRRKPESAILDYVHILLPHAPWHLLPTGQTYPNDSDLLGGLDTKSYEWDDAVTAAANRQHHVLQLEATDRAIGEIVTRLRKVDAYNDSVVVLTADHGIAFSAKNPYRTANQANYDQVAWVPLILKAPGIRGGVIDDRPARTIDVLPTLADMLKIQIRWRVDGRSLLRAPVASPVRFLDWPGRLAFFPPKVAVYKRYDRRVGFAKVLKARALPVSATSPLGMYSLGPYAAVIGKRASAFVDASKPAQKVPSVLLLNRRDYLTVNLKGSLLPAAFAHGGITGKEHFEIAIAVNGIVAGIGPTAVNFGYSPRFDLMLAPQLLRQGANKVDIYIVRGSPTKPRLMAMPLV